MQPLFLVIVSFLSLAVGRGFRSGDHVAWPTPNSTVDVPDWQKYDCLQRMIDTGIPALNTTAILPELKSKVIDTAATSGLWISNSNRHGTGHTFEFFENGYVPGGGPCERYGKSDIVFKTVSVPPGHVIFVPLPLDFLGHVSRSGGSPTTWAEFTLAANPQCNGDGLAHGSISVIQGNDGPAFVASSDLRVYSGFYRNIIPQAPRNALKRKDNGRLAIANTETSVFDEPANLVARQYERMIFPVSQQHVYVRSSDPVIDVGSRNNILFINFGPVLHLNEAEGPA